MARYNMRFPRESKTRKFIIFCGYCHVEIRNDSESPTGFIHVNDLLACEDAETMATPNYQILRG